MVRSSATQLRAECRVKGGKLDDRLDIDIDQHGSERGLCSIDGSPETRRSSRALGGLGAHVGMGDAAFIAIAFSGAQIVAC